MGTSSSDSDRAPFVRVLARRPAIGTSSSESESSDEPPLDSFAGGASTARQLPRF